MYKLKEIINEDKKKLGMSYNEFERLDFDTQRALIEAKRTKAKN